MTGMVVLLICASWVGDSGWQSTQAAATPATRSAVAGGSPVQPVVATEPWVGGPQSVGATVLDPAALQRAEQSVRQGIDRFSDAARELAVNTSVPGMPAGSGGSLWREIEGALLQPAQSPANAAEPGSRSFGAAGHLRVANYADQPPVPPADPYAGPAYPGNSYATTPVQVTPQPGVNYGQGGYGQPNYGNANLPPALPQDVPVDRGNVRRWLEQDQAGGYAGTQGSAVSSNRPRVGLPPGRDAFPEEEAAWARPAGQASASQNRWAHEREVSYEDRVAVNPRPERRYLDPPERDDDGGREAEAGRVRPDRDESSRRDRIAAREESRSEDREDDRVAESRPRRAGSRVVPASVEQEIEDAVAERKPWWPLMLTLLGLFASGGFNVYLGWIAWDLYTRHLDMLEDVRELESRCEKQQAALDAGSMTSGRSSRSTAMAG